MTSTQMLDLSSPCTFNELSQEIHYNTLFYLLFQNLSSINIVNKYWHNLVNSVLINFAKKINLPSPQVGDIRQRIKNCLKVHETLSHLYLSQHQLSKWVPGIIRQIKFLPNGTLIYENGRTFFIGDKLKMIPKNNSLNQGYDIIDHIDTYKNGVIASINNPKKGIQSFGVIAIGEGLNRSIRITSSKFSYSTAPENFITFQICETTTTLVAITCQHQVFSQSLNKDSQPTYHNVVASDLLVDNQTKTCFLVLDDGIKILDLQSNQIQKQYLVKCNDTISKIAQLPSQLIYITQQNYNSYTLGLAAKNGVSDKHEILQEAQYLDLQILQPEQNTFVVMQYENTITSLNFWYLGKLLKKLPLWHQAPLKNEKWTNKAYAQHIINTYQLYVVPNAQRIVASRADRHLGQDYPKCSATQDSLKVIDSSKIKVLSTYLKAIVFPELLTISSIDYNINKHRLYLAGELPSNTHNQRSQLLALCEKQSTNIQSVPSINPHKRKRQS